MAACLRCGGNANLGEFTWWWYKTVGLETWGSVFGSGGSTHTIATLGEALTSHICNSCDWALLRPLYSYSVVPLLIAGIGILVAFAGSETPVGIVPGLEGDVSSPPYVAYGVVCAAVAIGLLLGGAVWRVRSWNDWPPTTRLGWTLLLAWAVLFTGFSAIYIYHVGLPYSILAGALWLGVVATTFMACEVRGWLTATVGFLLSFGMIFTIGIADGVSPRMLIPFGWLGLLLALSGFFSGHINVDRLRLRYLESASPRQGFARMLHSDKTEYR